MKDIKEILDNFIHEGKDYIHYLSSSHPSDEAVVRQKIVLPILTDLLNYDLQQDINPEDRVGKGFIDVLVKVDDCPVFIIEIKKTLELNLKEHLPQLVRYAKGRGVKYGMLTNGRVILIYDFYINEQIPIFTVNLESIYNPELFTEDSLQAFSSLFLKESFRDIKTLQKEIAETVTRPFIMSHEYPQNDSILIDGLKNLLERLANLVKMRFVQFRTEETNFRSEIAQKLLILQDLKTKLSESVMRASNGNEDVVLPALREVLTDFEKNWRDFKVKEKKLEKCLQEIPQKLALDKETTLKKILKDITKIYSEVLLASDIDPESKKVRTALIKRDNIIKELENFLNSEDSIRKELLERLLSLLKKDYQKVGLEEFNTATKGIKTGVKVSLNTPEIIWDTRQYEKEFIKYQEWFSSENLRLRPVHQLLSSFEYWKHQLGIMGAEDKEAEFCLQTVYIFIIRILLVRIFEDKGLVSQKVSDGGYKTTEEFLSKLMVYVKEVNSIILDLAYKDAKQIYGHFFMRDIFDWYEWEDDSIVRVFYHLNRFDFKDVGSDLIGKIYEQYVDIIERRNKGQFYTPGEVVNYILDNVNYRGSEIVGKRLLDPACGSGRFLVEAARRLVNELKSLPLSPDELINERLRDSLYGIDINRFACFLSEVNILIQILDLVPKPTDKKPFTISRFHIYTTNTLIPSEERNYRLTTMFEIDHEMSETIKTRGHTPELGYDFTVGFDFVVGNPPYVKANRPGVDRMREEIKNTAMYETLHKKWDLYIPFIEFGVRSLSEGGRFSFIVPDSYPTVDYAEPSRQMLLNGYTIETLTFIPQIKLFEGADVYNFIFSASKNPMMARHQVKRFKIVEKPSVDEEMEYNTAHLYSIELKPLSQKRWGQRVFMMDFEGKDELEEVVSLEELCYISRGAELQANEKLYEKDEEKFIKDDLISLTKDKIHSKPFIEGKDIDRYSISRIRWLEWDTNRVPDKIRRPTFPDLYENPKIIVGKSSGAVYDENKLFSDQSGVIIIPYFELASALQKAIDINENKIESEFSYGNLLSDEVKQKIEERIGKELNLRYLLALINSNPLRNYFVRQIATGDTRSITPDDWRRFPVKLISPEGQKVFADLVDEITKLKYEIANKDFSIRVFLERNHIATVDLIDAAAFIKTNIDDKFALTACTLQDNRLILRKSPLYYIESDNYSALFYLNVFIAENMRDLKNLIPSEFIKKVRVPKTPEKVAEFLEMLEREKMLRWLKELHIKEIDDEIDELVIRLYGMGSAVEGNLYVIEDIPDTAQHVMVKQSKAVGDINKQCFKLDRQWMIRSAKKIPRYATVWWWDGKEHEEDKFIEELKDEP